MTPPAAARTRLDRQYTGRIPPGRHPGWVSFPGQRRPLHQRAGAQPPLSPGVGEAGWASARLPW